MRDVHLPLRVVQLTYQHVAKSPPLEEIPSSAVDFTSESLYFPAAHLGASFVDAIPRMFLSTIVLLVWRGKLAHISVAWICLC